MLLSKLELNGFKSFPNRIELQFDEGIMGVVGPNGCGKTNILDSIRWVLGEQRSSLLRGSKVEEVLFNGTARLSPIDMAEVNLTVKNNRGVLPLEYDEVMVTRRLYRSGESEYLLNKKRCRLKDITELFSDTGMGTHAYSIFQQSMIDAVLSDKAEERRFLFEEAAGINKYKNRKKEALRKLETTEIDIARINDIIIEISKNVRSLRRQASRARKYKSIKDELQALKTGRAAAQISDLEAEKTTVEGRITEFKTGKAGLTAAADREEARIETLKGDIDKFNEQISQKASLASDLTEQIIRSENNLTGIQASLSSGRKNVELWRSEANSLEQRIESLEAEKGGIEVLRSEKLNEHGELKAKLSPQENRIGLLKERIDKSESEIDTLKDKMHLYENEIAADQARLDSIKSSLERLSQMNDNIDRSLLTYRAKKESSQQSLDKQKDKLKNCEHRVNEIEEELRCNQQAHLSLVSKIDEIKKEISELKAKKSAAEAKSEMLSRMILEHEGYGSGIKALFGWEHRPEGVIDTLANLIATEKRFNNAVEAALNKYGQLVVCKTRDEALQCINFLQTSSSGRVGFLLLDYIKIEQIVEINVDDKNFIGRVSELIKIPDYLKDAVEVLFSDIAVFQAEKIPADFGGEAVDTNGQYFNGSCILDGGKSSITVIGRKSELADLSDLIITITNDLTRLERELADSQDELARLGEETNSHNEKKKTLLAERERLLAEMTRLEFEFQESRNRLDELTASVSETDRRKAELLQQKADLDSVIIGKTEKIDSISAEIKQKSKAHHELLDEFDEAVSLFNNLRLNSVELTGLLHKLDEDHKRLEEMIDEARKMINAKTEMIEKEQTGWLELERQREDIKSRLTKIFEAKDRVVEDRDSIGNQKNQLVESLSNAEARLKELRSKNNEIGDQIHSQELCLIDIESRLTNIRENIYHEYGVHVEGDKPADYNDQRVISNIERLERITQKIGPINMLADEEYNTEKGRLEFLERQFDDLQKAKTELVEVIKKINKTAEEKFSATFDLIKENFQKVFESLFEGGTAELRLTNPDDLLETPIEIIARPGSKKLVSVNQLSGGERALTAISLLFAIYMVKPSPFCILDEIDAPLDDANVNRFLKLVHKFTNSTQFIVITHNKKTMEAADLLYGVTMEQPGVSNIVSVKFNGGGVMGA